MVDLAEFILQYDLNLFLIFSCEAIIRLLIILCGSSVVHCCSSLPLGPNPIEFDPSKG